MRLLPTVFGSLFLVSSLFAQDGKAPDLNRRDYTISFEYEEFGRTLSVDLYDRNNKDNREYDLMAISLKCGNTRNKFPFEIYDRNTKTSYLINQRNGKTYATISQSQNTMLSHYAPECNLDNIF